MSRDESNPPRFQKSTQEEILSGLSHLRPLRVLVIGDLFLDSYIEGSISRINPEAPVPLLNAERNFAKPGGAGNVALNLKAMGNEVILLSRIGDDLIADQLLSLFKKIDTSALLREKGVVTGQKQRILSHQQQLLRIDWEKICPLSSSSEKKLLQRAAQLLPAIDIIALSDYGKGLCTPTFTAALIQMAQRFGCLVIVDPKGNDFRRYSGATLIKPNLAELYAAVDSAQELTLQQAVDAIFKSCARIDWILVTRSEEGMTLFDAKGYRAEFPAHFVKICDVTGAGDTAFAMLTHSWGCGLAPSDCAQLANCAAGIAVQQLGCAQISLFQIAKSIARPLVQQNTVATLSPAALKSLLWQERALLIAIDDEPMGLDCTMALIELIKCKRSFEDLKVVLYCHEKCVDPQVLRLLVSLKGIDFLFTKKGELTSLIALIDWSSIYYWKNRKFADKTANSATD